MITFLKFAYKRFGTSVMVWAAIQVLMTIFYVFKNRFEAGYNYSYSALQIFSTPLFFLLLSLGFTLLFTKLVKVVFTARTQEDVETLQHLVFWTGSLIVLNIFFSFFVQFGILRY